MTQPSLTFRAEYDAAGRVCDLVADRNGRSLPLLGPAGPERELAVLRVPERERLTAGEPSRQSQQSGQSGQSVPSDGSDQPDSSDSSCQPALPVLVGAGLGHALAELLNLTSGPVAVVDAHPEALALAGLRERFTDPRILWVVPDNPAQPLPPHAALARLTHWQERHNGKPLLPFVNPWYLRLEREWYDTIRTHLQASASYNFWEKAAVPRFQEALPRILLITSKYFLMGEVYGACERLGYPVRMLTLENMEEGGVDFVRRLLENVLTFRPDFVLTLNHLGVDREGVLADLLTRLRLPLASWFVDNPNLILHLYKGLSSPWTALFTWDADNVDGLKTLGYPHVHHLPLGTDPQRFRPNPDAGPLPAALRARVCFVGNSMVYKVAARLQKSSLPAGLLRGYRNTATAFGASSERSARAFILGQPHLAPVYETLPDLEAQMAFETLLTWEATRQYRAACVGQLMSFDPLIVGDRGWEILFRSRPESWRLHPEVNYYSELPRIYPACEINFNCTSKQMKGAVNQRLFDVPAAGGFLLTDLRAQMAELFEPGREVICYDDPAEVPDLLRFYLDHPEARKSVAEAARRRVLAEHTWDCRVRTMAETMRRIYS